MSTNIIYISYNGIEEPLVQSQVLAYLTKLNRHGFRFALITFETQDDEKWKERNRVQVPQGIDWHPIFARKTAIGRVMGFMRASRLARRLAITMPAGLIHARSFIPTVIAFMVSRGSTIPYLFDNRGFWVEEKIQKGRLKRGSISHQILRRIESTLYRHSAHIVSLTKRGRDELTRSGVSSDDQPNKISVIPTCVSMRRPIKRKKCHVPVIGYLGSLGQGYLADAVFQFFQVARKHDQEARLLIVTRSDQAPLNDLVHEYGFPGNAVTIKSSTFAGIPHELAKMNIGLSMIEPHYAKLASCPTKLGEYLAAGIPVVANSNIGDTDEILRKYNVGIVVDHLSPGSMDDAWHAVKDLAHDDQLPERCHRAVAQVFDLDKGVECYRQIYERLLNG